MLTLRATVGATELAFLITITSFSAPNTVTLDELQIESYLPLDDTTRQFFESLEQRPELGRNMAIPAAFSLRI